MHYMLPEKIFPFVLMIMAGGSADSFAENDSCLLNIKAVDLTEDMSTLSTQNDEMLILLYAQADTLSPLIPILSANHTFQKDSMTFSLGLPKPDEFSRLLLLLVEMDSYKADEQIDAVLRIHHAEIYRRKREEDRAGIVKFLGDDDLIGFNIFDREQLQKCKLEFSLNGYFLLDKYEYRISFR